jgi:predicted DNA-binding transcriptional regulator YafY
MSRSERLLDLIQLLRRHRFPVSGAVLADELGVSVRTLYRDIRTLQAQGAHIDGEPGFGYVLRPGFLLPPLMFEEEELEALVLGSRWVSRRADTRLATAARNALAKIGAVLPKDLLATLDDTGLLVGPGEPIPAGEAELPLVRKAIRGEQKVAISYRDRNADETQRTIWPIALAFFDKARVVIAWCELRQDFRNFRTDRIAALKVLPQAYPRRRRMLLKEWKDKEGIPER